MLTPDQHCTVPRIPGSLPWDLRLMRERRQALAGQASQEIRLVLVAVAFLFVGLEVVVAQERGTIDETII